MEMAQMNVQKPARKSVIDIEIVFECLHEVYGRESSLLLSGKDVRTTMVYPFLKMLTSQCRGILPEGIHKVLWEIYQNSSGKDDFIEKAEIIVTPYRYE